MISDNVSEEKIFDNPLINKVFSKDKTKCVGSNQGLSACINSKCTNKNPFVCNSEECQCTEIHE